MGLDKAKLKCAYIITHCGDKRLKELGFTENSVVIPLAQAPLGGETRAYWVRGCVMALRHNDASLVIVKEREE